ncbi:mammalian cell entry protein [Nocardia nova]|uniref:Mammalian cell entry protein n=1 Tax=Nocardia nova TaxID=37330 RepID=A0A2S6AKG9_9NOCA|nr:MlaD family protein [Nocardia nova]PPJ35725.1 mammalian cell entry protein [Nocardia nova]
MMKSRLVKAQLIVFSVLAVVSLVYGLLRYVNVQRLTGIGTYTVTVEFTEASGLYTNALVTYRGSDIGRVTRIDMRDNKAEVQLQIRSDNDKIPATTAAAIKSMSAVGEQYVDLIPDDDKGPYLHNGSRISLRKTSVPTPTGKVLDNLQTLLANIHTDNLNKAVDEAAAALDGTGPALSGLIESSSSLIHLAQADLGPTLTLINDAEPLLTTTDAAGPDIRSFSHDLASFTHQLVLSDSRIRNLLDQGPSTADMVAGTFTELTPTLPLLLADLQTVGQVLRVNVPELRQILTIYPALSAVVNNSAVGYQDSSDPQLPLPLDIKLGDTLNPPPCTEGYQGTVRRDPSDTGPVPATPGQHCDVRADNPKVVRGARNVPCATDPSTRTADVANCPRGLPSTWPEMLARPGAPSTGPQPSPEPAPPPPPTGAPAAITVPAPGLTAVPYSESSGTFRGPDGITYLIGPAPAATGKEVNGWQSLLIK